MSDFADVKVKDHFDNAFDEEEGAKEKGEISHAGYWVREQKETRESVQYREQDLPQKPANAVRMESKYKMGYGCEQNQPGE